MERDTGITLKTLKTDGGASRDEFLMQFQADIADKKVVRPVIRETTALGAAFLAGLGSGVWKDKKELKKLWQADKKYVPSMNREEREKRLDKWRDAVRRCLGWAKE